MHSDAAFQSQVNANTNRKSQFKLISDQEIIYIYMYMHCFRKRNLFNTLAKKKWQKNREIIKFKDPWIIDVAGVIKLNQFKSCQTNFIRLTRVASAIEVAQRLCWIKPATHK